MAIKTSNHVRVANTLKIEAGYGDATRTFVREVKAHFYISSFVAIIKSWLAMFNARQKVSSCALHRRLTNARRSIGRKYAIIGSSRQLLLVIYVRARKGRGPPGRQDKID